MGLDGYCQNALLLQIIAIIKLIIKILQIVTPIMVIVLLSFSLYHYLSDPDKGKNKVITRFKNGIISLLVIFLIPTVFNNVIHSLTNGSYVTHCWDEADTEVNLAGSFLDDEKVSFNEDPLSGSVNTENMESSTETTTSNGENNNGTTTNYASNATGNTAKLLEIAQKRWLDIVHGGYQYEAGSNQVPFSPPYVDCSTYISDVLYHMGYTDFAGLQNHTKEFMETDWNSKYGWTEIPVAGEKM